MIIKEIEKEVNKLEFNKALELRDSLAIVCDLTPEELVKDLCLVTYLAIVSNNVAERARAFVAKEGK